MYMAPQWKWATAIVWVLVGALVGILVPVGLIASARAMPDWMLESDAVRVLARSLWPTSELLPPLVDSVDPHRSEHLVVRAVIMNGIPYAVAACLLYALRASFRR